MGASTTQMTIHKRWRTTKAIQQRAKELRREQTSAEGKLWAKLRGKRSWISTALLASSRVGWVAAHLPPPNNFCEGSHPRW